MRLILKENPNGFRWTLTPEPSLPLCEGKCPPAVDENGNGYYPEPAPYAKPEECIETDKYEIKDRDEFWDYVTVCKKCGCEFMAYVYKTQGVDGHVAVRNFCPGCGERLVAE